MALVMVRLVPPELHVGERLGQDDHGFTLLSLSMFSSTVMVSGPFKV